jgi:hypothetical protein
MFHVQNRKENPWKKVMKNTNQQNKNDPDKVTKLAQEEWDQTDTWLAKYGQNRERTSGWNYQIGYCLVGGLWKRGFPPKIHPFLPKLDSWAIGNQIRWNLDPRVTSTQGISSQKRFFPNSKIPLPILNELKNLGFKGTKRNQSNGRS